MSIARILPAALLLSLPALAQDATKHLVRYSFKAGTVQHSLTEQQMKMTMNMGAQDMVTDMKMSMFSTTRIKSTKGNTAEIEQVITRVKAKADSIAMKVDYDSAIEDSDPGMLGGLADMVNAKSSLKLSDQGKMSDIQMPNNAETIKAAGIDLQQVLSQSVTQLPDTPLALGETWKVKQSMPMGQMGDAEAEVRYKLIATDDKHITLEQEMLIDADKLKMPTGKIDSITAKGRLKIDVRTGMPIEMDMKMSTKMSGQIKMTMELTQRVRPAPAPVKKPSVEKPTTGKDAPKKAASGG